MAANYSSSLATMRAGANVPAAQQAQPQLSLRGLPPLRQAAVLTDRRHVVTQDEEGRVQLWDITAGAPLMPAGQRLTPINAAL